MAIEYTNAKGQKAYIDPAMIYRHEATNTLHVMSDGKLRAVSADEAKALKKKK